MTFKIGTKNFNNDGQQCYMTCIATKALYNAYPILCKCIHVQPLTNYFIRTGSGIEYSIAPLLLSLCPSVCQIQCY